MAAYEYTAIANTGKTIKGTLEADSAKVVRQKLRDQGLTPLSVMSITRVKRSESKIGIRKGKRIRVADLALLTRQLATLLAAGLPVEESLQGVAEQTEKAYIKGILLGVRSYVLEGQSLANAMKQFPSTFPHLYCATIGAGEQTGKLHVVLSRLADYTEQQQVMRQKIQQALIYPALMTIVSIVIVTFLLIFVVPKIIGVFTSTGQTLPDVTIVLIAISHFIATYGVYLLILFIAILFLLQRLLQKDTFKFKWDTLLLKMPLLGNIIKTINTARYARTFGILFAAGVNVIEAMQTSSTLITNLPMRKAIANAAIKVREGTNINLALKQTGYFSPMTIHLIASGEASGQLETMLERAADNQDNSVKRVIDTGLTLFEPLIILIMGAIVLFIVLAILLPIFNLDQFTG